jgi:chromosome segregation ATPase
VEPGGAYIAAESSGNAIRELADRLVEEAARASEFRARLEIAATAESTLREELDEERRLREEAEREREDLRQQLEVLRQSPEVAEAAEEQQGRGQLRSTTVESQEPVQRPWWRRILG